MRLPSPGFSPWIRRRWRALFATAERRRLLLVLLLAVLLYPWTSGEPLPVNRHDLCALFAEKPTWHEALAASAERWQVPIAVQMAIVQRESGFHSKARPPRKKILGLRIGPRPSSAYGYGQVLDATWDDFRQRPGRRAARRDRFTDVAPFMGWYLQHLHRTTGVAKDDAYNLYLAYHEGPKGFLQARHRDKPWLQRAARQVALQSDRFADQLVACERRLLRLRYLRWLIRGGLIALLIALVWRCWS